MCGVVAGRAAVPIRACGIEACMAGQVAARWRPSGGQVAVKRPPSDGQVAVKWHCVKSARHVASIGGGTSAILPKVGNRNREVPAGQRHRGCYKITQAEAATKRTAAPRGTKQRPGAIRDKAQSSVQAQCMARRTAQPQVCKPVCRPSLIPGAHPAVPPFHRRMRAEPLTSQMHVARLSLLNVLPNQQHDRPLTAGCAEGLLARAPAFSPPGLDRITSIASIITSIMVSSARTRPGHSHCRNSWDMQCHGKGSAMGHAVPWDMQLSTVIWCQRIGLLGSVPHHCHTSAVMAVERNTGQKSHLPTFGMPWYVFPSTYHPHPHRLTYLDSAHVLMDDRFCASIT
eukprot:364487-Chlamydomonas_euryale.AAC.25